MVGRAHTAAEAVSLVERKNPDALLVDLDFGPGPTGLDIAASLRKDLRLAGIVVLSAYRDPTCIPGTSVMLRWAWSTSSPSRSPPPA